ncbi:MAG: FxsA family protein, partial [Candidatus Thiodiazotropha sp. (ex Lucinoma borealis)]|nr:FxsA family protein [Candidatus Thiodiazotropha sp. (ex Lucinoma borealis)]
FITDVVGFIFLVPPFRRWLLAAGLQNGGIMKPAQQNSEQPQKNETRVIEGEFQREDEKDRG